MNLLYINKQISLFAAILSAFFLTVLFSYPALAEKRVALVIGNSNYTGTTVLKNPANDAADISAVLKRLDFEVIKGLDLDHNGMRRALRDFSAAIQTADVALFYYAGHALQVNGNNFLAPTDIALEQESDLEFETHSLELIQRQMEQNAKTILVFLDACRDNPLSRRFVRTGRSTASRGLARPNASPEGAMIAFATQPGNVALDGDGRNSPFTTALLKHIERPGVEISALMTDVRREVYNDTQQQQLPWTNSALLGHFYFNKNASTPVTSPSVKPSPNQNSDDKLSTFNQQNAIWNAISETNDASTVQNFINNFPDSPLRPIAEFKLKQLREKSQPQKLASLPTTPKTDERSTLNATDPENAPRPITPQLVRSVQTELNRLGCSAGTVDGKWGAKGRRALGTYSRSSNKKFASLEPTLEVLDDLKKHEVRVCPLVCSVRQTISNGQCVTKLCPKGKRLNSKGACRAVNKRVTTTRSKKPTTRTRVRKPSGGKNCFKFNGQTVCN